MPNLLAIDTASANCSVALSTSGTCSSRSSSTARHAAQSVLPMIEDLLDEAGLALSQLDVIAILAGPGSFTGIRIGIGIAQGLGMANATPLLPLSSLAVVAYAALQQRAVTTALVSVKARDDEVYFGCYRRSATAGVELLGLEQVGVPAELQLAVQDDTSTVLVGDGWEQREALAAVLQRPIADNDIVEPEFNIADLVHLAALRYGLGQAVTAELALPNYVKENMQYAR